MIGIAREPILSHAEIERIIQKSLAIRADVEHNGEHAGGIDARSRSVDHELADGDIDAVCPPVADAKNLLGIRNDDQTDFAVARSTVEDILELCFIILGEVDGVLRINKFVAVPFDTLGDDRIVDDGHHLFDVLGKHFEEERAVDGEDAHEVLAFLQGRRFLLIEFIRLRRLLIERLHGGRQESPQTEAVAFLLGERAPLIEERIVQNVIRCHDDTLPHPIL